MYCNRKKVGHVLEDVLRHRAPRPLDEHADAHQDAVEKVLLNLKTKYLTMLNSKICTFGKALAPQMNPIKQVSTLLLTMEGEAPCCSKNTKLQLWKLFPWSDFCRFCWYICTEKESISIETKRCTLMTTLPACLTKTALCRSSREALLPPSF